VSACKFDAIAIVDGLAIVDYEKCTGCTACLKACPVEAVSGEKKEVHTIDQDKCTRCGACFEACKFEAVGVE